jgi:hypothetical protein
VLLPIGLLPRLTELILATIMVGAIVVSGFGHGDVIPSLTLAPLLLAAMLFLFWAGRGSEGQPEQLPLRRRPEPR